MKIDDEDIEKITEDAYNEFGKYSRAIRGQTLTIRDSLEYWVVLSTLKFLERNET
jgi:hypothetical protein